MTGWGRYVCTTWRVVCQQVAHSGTGCCQDFGLRAWRGSGRFAQFERERASERRSEAAVKLARDGRLNCGDWVIPYRYRRGMDGTPEVVPEEAEVLRSIAAMILGGMTLTQVCENLTAAGTETRRGGTWHVTMVSKMMRRLSEPYARDADGTPYYLPEIIPPGDLAAVQAELAKRSFTRKTQEQDMARHDGSMLLAVAVCPRDHRLYSFRTRSSRGSKQHAYYRCYQCKGKMVRHDEPERIADEWAGFYLAAARTDSRAPALT